MSSEVRRLLKDVFFFFMSSQTDSIEKDDNTSFKVMEGKSYKDMLNLYLSAINSLRCLIGLPHSSEKGRF